MRAQWKIKPLGELCDILDSKRKPITKKDRTSGEFPYYGATGILDYVEDYIFDEKLVLIGEDGAKWGAGENTAFAAEGKYWVNNHAHVIRPHRGIVLDEWIIYHLNANDLSPFITGLTVPKLNQAKLRDIPIPLVPLPEQKRIVAILDEAFEGIGAAVTNAEKNLANARDLFESYLNSVFANESSLVAKASKEPASKNARHVVSHENLFDIEETTKTGGRAATTRHIPGNFSLSVGMPKIGARKGWNWLLLTALARLESGHTPSRRHPEYWGGDVPWIGIRDAKRFHGEDITETEGRVNQLGLANSSARLLPSGTVCLSRTASVGYVCVMGRPMATSQDFVNWVCGNELNPHFLKYLLMAQGDEIFKFSSGAVHQTIYFPEAKAFHVCIPDLDEQARIVTQADSLKENSEHLQSIYRKKLSDLTELKQSILQKAFAGELTAQPQQFLQEAFA